MNEQKENLKESQDAEKKAVKENNKSRKENKAAKDLEELKKKLEEAEAAAEKAKADMAKEKDDYIRLMAEFETFRRRTAEDKLNLVASASAETIKGMLPVLDDCERAMELLKTSQDEAAKEGTALIYDKLLKYLQSKGLERIEAKGQKFDTDFHEAVAQMPVEEKDKGLVFDVIKTGYTLGGKIIRYAQVVVGI